MLGRMPPYTAWGLLEEAPSEGSGEEEDKEEEEEDPGKGDPISLVPDSALPEVVPSSGSGTRNRRSVPAPPGSSSVSSLNLVSYLEGNRARGSSIMTFR